MRAGHVHEREHGQLEPLGEQHRAHRLAVALGMGHAEVAPDVLVGVGALLLADDHHAVTLDARETGDHRRIVAEEAIAVELDPLVREVRDELERPGPVQVSGELDSRPHGVPGVIRRVARAVAA